jgi:chaperonin GroES
VEWSVLYDKLMVRRDPAKTSYDAEGRLAVADKHKEDQTQGTVLQTGKGRWVDGLLLPLTIQPGMKVLFSKFAGVPLEGADPDILILREDEVLAFKS